MDLIGIEPMTSSMPWKRAPSCATGPLIGGTLLFSRMRAGKSNHATEQSGSARCLTWWLDSELQELATGRVSIG